MKPLSPNSELHPPSSQPLTTVSPPNPDSETRLPLICRLNPKPENWFDMICDEITRIGREEARPEESDEEEVDEENIYSYLDGQRFPKCSRYWTPEYQASREARRRPMRPMSPPPTTPHLKGRKLLESNSIPPLQLTNAKIQKKRAFQRQRHRRPMTRSMSGKLLALPHRKGFVRCEPLINKYLDVSFKQYVRDFDDLDLREKYPEYYGQDMLVTPNCQKQADYQRIMTAHIERHHAAMENAVEMPAADRDNRWGSW